MSSRTHTINKIMLVLVAAMVVGLASETAAQWDTQPDTPESPAVVAPQPPPAPGTPSQQWPSALVTETPAPPPKKQGPKVQPQWGMGIGVPLFLDVEREVVRPGAQLDFWAAADFGFITLGGRLGFGWTPIELSKETEFPELQRFGRNPLRRVNFSPEVRLQIPGKKVLPYLSNAFDMNWWNFLETSVACGWWYCSSFGVYRFTPGYTGRVGLGIRAVKTFHVDLGFAWSLTGKGDFFAEKHWSLGPYAGFLFRR